MGSWLRAKLAAGENLKEERERTTVLPATEKVPGSLQIPLTFIPLNEILK